MAPKDFFLMKFILKWQLMSKTHLRIKPLFTVVFIFSTRCSTFVYKPPQTVRTQHRKDEGLDSNAYLQVSNVEFLLKDVGRICAGRQSSHGSQVTTVASHRLHDEHAALRPRRRLFDPVAGLQRREERSVAWLCTSRRRHLRR